MSKDPAFLFYDGDAAKDVSHMNRLERGAYFDLIQAQRKFHGITTEQARKILGNDFDACWGAIELVLCRDEEEKWFIEWLRESINKRKKHSEQQRTRIQSYWDKKNKSIPRNNHGITTVIPLENENENENENRIEDKREKKSAERKREISNFPPTVEEVGKYCLSRNNGIDPQKFVDYYEARGWMIGKNKMKSWQAAVRTWEGNRKETSHQQTSFIAQPSRGSLDQLTDVSAIRRACG